MPVATVIIVSWNGRHYLEGCLPTLREQTFQDFNIILVDNGSEDGTTSFVRENYPEIDLLPLDTNTGFAWPNNLGFRKAFEDPQVRFVITLNNDTRVEPTFLAELVRMADTDPDIGMVAAKVLYFYEPGRIDSVGIRVSKNGLGYNIGNGEPDVGQYDRPAEVFGACAGAALYSRSMLEDVGFFDNAFFAYYEDLDLAWRGRLAGWRCVAAPKATVYHIHSATAVKGSPFKTYQIHRNKWYTIIKNWPSRLLWMWLPYLVLVDIASFLLALFRGRGLAAIKARLDVVCEIPRLARKRREVQQIKKMSFSGVTDFFSSVWHNSSDD